MGVSGVLYVLLREEHLSQKIHDVHVQWQWQWQWVVEV
jgi:hypothetical protein